MTTESSNTLETRNDVTFEAVGGLFGGTGESLGWDAFLGIGGDRPVTTDVDIGGPLNIWLPFVGDTEVLRLQLLGEIATRMGLDINFEVSPGQTAVTLPYDVGYRYPDTATLVANPFFRLEGDGTFENSAEAGFATEWPFLTFSIDAIFELAVLMNLVAGVLGDNATIKLLDFDVGVEVPIIDLDTRPDEDPTFFGVEFGDNTTASLELPDDTFVSNPTSFQVSLSGSDIKVVADEAEEETNEKDTKSKKKDDDTDDDVRANGDKKDNSLLDKLDISAGDLATLTLNLPDINLEDRGTDQSLGLDGGDVFYRDGTRDGDVDHNGADEEALGSQLGFINELALLEIDIDDIAIEAIKRAFTGGVGVPNTPGLEGSIGLDLEAGPFAAGAYFDYNLLDADLEFSIPIEQTIDVTPETLQSSLSFYRADASGEVIVNSDGSREATWLEARIPRLSVYFNESNTFWNETVALQLREASGVSRSAAEDIGRFVDFSNGRIPGAFTGQTDSVSGGVVRREAGSSEWLQLSTNPEETEWLARTRPDPGGDPQLDDLRPRDDAEFRYVIYNSDTTVTSRTNADGSVDRIVNLATAEAHAELSFADLVGPDGIFEARMDVVTAPLYSTGLVEGLPSLDLIFPDLANESIWAEVTHRAAANVANDTSLDFNIDFVLTALELAVGAYVEAFGARLGIDFEVGPLWEKSFPILSVELAKLFDDTFEVSETAFDVAGQEQDGWGFALGANGPDTTFATQATNTADLFDGTEVTAGTTLDGRNGRDTLTFVRQVLDAGDPGFEANLDTGQVARIGGGLTYEVASIENLSGTAAADSLTGDDERNTIEGGLGDDTLDGRGGPDLLVGSAGQDILITGGTSEGRDSAFGGEGDDRLVAGAGAALLDGGEDAPAGTSGLPPADLDIVDYREAPGAITYNQQTGDASGSWIADHELVDIEGIAATRFDDNLTGDRDRSYFEAGDGDDTLIGDDIPDGLSRQELVSLRGGNDRLYGQAGDDLLIGGPGADMLDGGAGDDTVDYSGDPTSVFVDLADGEIIAGEDFAPLLQGTGSEDIDAWRIDGRAWRGWAQGDKFRDVENVRGSDYEDIIFGDAGANLLIGGDGDDRLTGRDGKDTIEAGDGDDIIWTKSNGVSIELTFDPESNNVSEAKVNDASLRNPTAYDPSKTGGDVDVVRGGEGFDLQILEHPELVTMVHNNVLREVQANGDVVDVGYELRLIGNIGQRRLGDLENQIVGVEIPDQEIDDFDLSITAARREGEDNFSVLQQTPSSLWSNVFSGTTFLPGFQGQAGSTFAHSFDGIDMSGPVFVPMAEISSIEGLIGSTQIDILLGSTGDDRLYGQGGPDVISAATGEDTVAFGRGQAPDQLFSFPGQSVRGISPYSSAVVIAGDFTTSASDESRTFGTVSRISTDGGRTFLSDRFNVEPDFTFTPTQTEAYRTLIEAYLASDRSREKLEALRGDLLRTDDPNNSTDSSDFGFFTMLDAGDGQDVLDLRFDRGLDFLPDAGEEFGLGARVYLDEYYASIGGRTLVNDLSSQLTGAERALIFDIEDVVGSDRDDIIVGSDGDNVIEGMKGADTLDGGGGVDTLSYANASNGVTAVLQVSQGSSAIYLRAEGEEAEGDRFEGFEILGGSMRGDLIGIEATDATTAVQVSENAIQLVDGGDGDDRILAGQKGTTYDGGDGDDRIFVQGGDVSTGEGTMTLRGGDGVDRIVLVDTDLADLTRVDGGWQARLDSDTGTLLQISGIEYIDTADGILNLVNTDPSDVTTRDQVWPEDPWSVIRPFEDGGISQLTQTAGRVTSTSFNGTFQVERDGSFVDVAIDDLLTPEELETLLFRPGVNFGTPVGADNAQLTGAVLGLAIELADGTTQEREIRVDPGDLDGASLRLGTPTDVARGPVTYDLGSIALDTEPNVTRVHLGALGRADEAAVTARVEGSATPDRSRDVAEMMFGQTLTDALVTGRFGEEQTYEIREISAGGRLYLTAEPSDEVLAGTSTDWTNEQELFAGDIVSRAELSRLAYERVDGFIDETDAVTFLPEEQLDAVITGVPDEGQVFSSVSALDLDVDAVPGDGPLQITSLPEEGTLFYRNAAQERVEVAVGDELTRDQIGRLLFDANGQRKATVSSDADLAEAFAALNLPTVEAGDPGEGSAGLPTDPTAIDLGFRPVEDEAVFDGVTVDLAATGQNYVVPIGNGTAARISQEVYRFAGLFAFDYEIRHALVEDVEWVQWELEDGGNGHFYAFARFEDMVSAEVNSGAVPLRDLDNQFSENSAQEISEFLDMWNTRLGTPDLTGTQATPLTMASIASVEENDFVYSLIADDPDAINGLLGPRLGARRDGETWTWDDGTPWDVTVWAEGQPDATGTQNTVIYGEAAIGPAGDMSLPTWNDTADFFNATGAIIEAPTLATNRADQLFGSDQDDIMSGGGGNDLIEGLVGNDSLIGGFGDDTLSGGGGDDVLTGGEGRDVYVMGRDAGVDRITDWTFGEDRLDLSRLNVSSLSEIRIEQTAADLVVNAKGTQLILEGFGTDNRVLSLTAEDVTGLVLRLGASIPTIEERVLSDGDRIHLDELDGLRYRAPLDFNGDAGTLEYEVVDPWAGELTDRFLPEGRDGVAQGRVSVELTPVNDAPRGVDRTFLVSEGGTLQATLDGLGLTATDPEGDSVTFRLLDGPDHGRLQLSQSGAFTYTPDADFRGDPLVAADDGFTYAVSDGQAERQHSVIFDIADTSALVVTPESAETNEDGLLEHGGLSSDDNLGGTEGNDAIDAGFGNDTVAAYGGNDSLIGGGGNDRLDAADGEDTLRGNGGNDTLIGGNGVDLLDGGPGRDVMNGGEGGDTYIVDNSNDRVIETGQTSGVDRVFASANVNLAGSHVERLQLQGEVGLSARLNGLDNSVLGTSGGDTIDGEAGDDVIRGGEGNDVLVGREGQDDLRGEGGNDTINGGAGADTMNGGQGSDTFRVDNPGDVIIESRGWTGRDTVITSVDYAIGSANVEVVRVTGAAVTVTGNGLANRLEGAGGDDTLRGAGGNDTLIGGNGVDRLEGGSGRNVLAGGEGGDLYVVTSAQDNVIENRTTSGIDHVISSVDFRMGRDHIETLKLSGDARLGAGNGLENRIAGNASDNILDGGKNVDTLIGGAGDDIYLIRSPGDTAIEAADGGTDTVRAFRSHVLEDNIEQLFIQTLRNPAGDPVQGVSAFGNDLANLIIGNPFNNVIGGREGNDTLRGQAGADTFVFDTSPARGAGVDRILDFNLNTGREGDKLRFDGDVFSRLAEGALDADAFHLGTRAADRDDRLIFDQATGRLWYDGNGSAAGGQSLVAILDNGAVLTAAMIDVV